jgi:Spy/CpxP family protein refolding chaperone
MRNRILVAAFAAVAALGGTMVVARAQDQQAAPQQQSERGHGHRQFDSQQRVNILAKRLNLSDDQKQKLTTIFSDSQQQMQSIRQDSSLSREDKMAKMKSLREQTDNKINGILNDDQKQKYAQMREQARERMQDRQGGGQAPNDKQ